MHFHTTIVAAVPGVILLHLTPPQRRRRQQRLRIAPQVLHHALHQCLGQRLFHVGRLDADTEGLLLLTNDGELAHRLMHPSFEVPKTYLATLKGEVPRGIGRRMREGVELDDGPVTVDKFTVIEVHEGQSLVRITLHEGRNRVVRRMMDEVGFPVVKLVRTHVGSVALGEQRPGSLRVLGNDEVGGLYKAVGL